MRNLNPYQDPHEQLRDGESLLPSGGIDGLNFYTAINDEDYLPKKERLKHRRNQRKQKITKKWNES